MLRDRSRIADRAVENLVDEVGQIARPLKTAEDLDPLFDWIGDAQYVLLGEAADGAAEYHQWRALLSSRLAQKGFDFVAVEGVPPDTYSWWI